MTNDRQVIGVIGLGLMGEVLADRLMAAGFGVQGHDIDPAKNARLAARGGEAVPLAEVARRDVVVLAVFSTDQVEDVVERTLKPVGGGKIVLCTSTCDPDRIAALAARVAPDIRFLETPVSGTSEQVRNGEGLGLIGGDPQVAAEVKPLLDAVFPRRVHIGQWGDGGRAKLAVNLILGLNRLALAKGIVTAPNAARSRSEDVPAGGEGFGGLFAVHGHQGCQDGRARVQAAGLHPPVAQGHAPDPRSSGARRPDVAGARRQHWSTYWNLASAPARPRTTTAA